MSLGVSAGCGGGKGQSNSTVEDLLIQWNGHEDLWVFAYGSLIWHPGFVYQERRLATVRGYHRSLCLWSRDHRGSPDNPGLVFGLDRGGCCRGVAFRIAAAEVPQVFQALWRREMITGAYVPKWLPCYTSTQPVRALVFLLNRACEEYARALSDECLLAAVRNAVGHSGPCLEYVVQTEKALKACGINDWRLGLLVSKLANEAAACGVPAGESA